MLSNSPRMTLIELYQSQGAKGNSSENASALLKQTHWFTVNADFDPMTGEALPQALSGFLAKVAQPATTGTLQDRLWRITEHARPSVERLFQTLNESPRREHALLPVRAVRELDANSFIKLSNRPGRTIREKLSSKPYLQAVRRFQSVNLLENRLLKECVTRLAELLELRHDCLGEDEDELLPNIQSWLLSDETQSIARWDNVPPNNALLSHRDYRRVWDAWRWMQTLDDDIARDFSQLQVRDKTMRLWTGYGRMYLDGTFLFAEMPVLFDYEQFEIRPWVSQLAFKEVTRKLVRSSDTKEISESSCVDLALLYPRYATANSSSKSLYETYLWQQWKNDDESVDVELFNSDAAYLHPDAASVFSTDLFFSKDNTLEHLDRAARAFASALRGVFKDDKLIWLVPDFLNDFELEITRRNINACFTNAEPLPRSVAAVFERVDYSKIKNAGFPIVVVDTIGGKTCATKLIAQLDPELKKRLPETKGFYWERCPPVIISPRDTGSTEGKEQQNYDIITVDGKGEWHDQIRTEKPGFIDASILKGDPRIGQFAFCIYLAESPVDGGIRLHALQQRTGDIPLWRDQIPGLSIKVRKDIRGIRFDKRFHLVSRGTTVKPIRGLSIPIPVRENFMLPAGRPFYQFPLFQGENADELGFSARLDSPAFPLKTDVICELSLTFAYGDNEPYKLSFEPLDRSFPPVRATWRRTVEEIISDAPAPAYPTPRSWADLRNEPKPGSEETRDLLEWALDAVDKLDRDLFIRPRKRTVGKIIREWLEDKNGDHYSFVKCDDDDIDTNVFIHEHGFVEGWDYGDFEADDEVSFELHERNEELTGRQVADSSYTERTRLRSLDDNATKDLVESIYKRLYFPFIQVWRDGRSVTDKGCPKNFADTARNKIAYLTGLLSQAKLPRSVKDRLLFLLACVHKDTTDDCKKWITEQVKHDNSRNQKAVGFAIGDVSEEWQQTIFSSLASRPNESAISVFAYAIWHEQHFVERFSISELRAILNALLQRFAKIRTVELKGDKEKNKRTSRNWVRDTAEPLELLLGLLRTRASTSLEIKMLLQPHQKITKKLAEQVERVMGIVAQSNVNLFSRVQLNIKKPPGDRTPDVLYALRLYLTGNDGANAIHITSVSDNEND
jgi:hypothetical protein